MTHIQSAFGALSQTNQQPQIPQQNQNPCPAMQTTPSGLFNQQTGNLCTSQQPLRQAYNNAYLASNQSPTCNNLFAQAIPAATYPSGAPSGCYLPQNVLDQLRSVANAASTPIFILPAGVTSSSNSASPCVAPCFSPTCIPYPMPLPVYHPFGSKSSSEKSCTCASSSSSSKYQSSDSHEDWHKEMGSALAWDTEHVCKESSEGAVCSKKNCPASIQLQAMISQLLSIQGVIPSAITRLLLRRVPASNIADSVDEIMDKAMRCIRQQAKDALLRESCTSREVTKLLSLYLTSASTLPRIIPVLTTVQLKCNILKALVENLVNSRLMEEQSCGVDSDEPLDRLLIELKPDDELRQMLAALRQRECDERVNTSFASSNSQKRLAEARLCSVQRKIQQVEAEIERRRDMPVGQGQCSNLRDTCSNNSSNQSANLCDSLKKLSGMHFDSPDPFAEIRLRSPKKLLLKPHVGSPETTYEKPSETCKSIPSESEVRSDECESPRDEDLRPVANDAEPANKYGQILNDRQNRSNV